MEQENYLKLFNEFELIVAEQKQLKILLQDIKGRVTPKQSDYMNKKDQYRQIAHNLVNRIK